MFRTNVSRNPTIARQSAATNRMSHTSANVLGSSAARPKALPVTGCNNKLATPAKMPETAEATSQSARRASDPILMFLGRRGVCERMAWNGL